MSTDATPEVKVSKTDAEAHEWTDELRADLQRHVQAWYDAHPGLKEGLSESRLAYWNSPEGEAAKKALAEASQAQAHAGS